MPAISIGSCASVDSVDRAIDQRIERDRRDYERFLVEYGFTEAGIQPAVQFQGDQVPMPAGFPVVLRESPIHGLGLFATRDIARGARIAPARIGAARTPAGRYTNHSTRPNAVFGADRDGGISLFATLPISSGAELLVDYRQAGAVNGHGVRPDPLEAARTLALRMEGSGVDASAIELLAMSESQALGYIPADFGHHAIEGEAA